MPKTEVQDLMMAQKFIENLLPGLIAPDYFLSFYMLIIFIGNLLEGAKFGPFYPNASK